MNFNNILLLYTGITLILEILKVEVQVPMDQQAMMTLNLGTWDLNLQMCWSLSAAENVKDFLAMCMHA